ncbi:hypothetical protein [Thomasclavelia sp.]|uniref:hypothetical protein n=1 Tax=Thomasclavelia sp. TaxID=3025757 RepID=UPI0025D95EAD|nr:hypothetical protein [Thomasclavelia sp.]
MTLEKITNSKIVTTINQALTPLFLIGNLASISYLSYRLFNFTIGYDLCILITTHLPLIVASILTYFFTHKIIYSLFSVFILLIAKQDNYLIAYLLPISLFYLDIYFQKYLVNYHFISDLPKFVEDSLKNILLAIMIILLTLICSYLHFNLSCLSIFDSFFTCIIVVFLYCFLFYRGYHPAILLSVLGPVQLLFLNENIQAALLNLPLEHIFTHGSMSAFANLSGTGVTIGIAFLSRKKFSGGLKAAWFGVNENIIFGLPITNNKKAFVPYVIGGTILGSFPFILMALGYLNKPLFDAPYLGFFIESYLVNFDFRSILVNLIQIIGSLLIWKSCFKN